jgi:DNA polymerase IV
MRTAVIGSDYRKPGGLLVIAQSIGPAFVEELPIGKFHGVELVMAIRNGGAEPMRGRGER